MTTTRTMHLSVKQIEHIDHFDGLSFECSFKVTRRNNKTLELWITCPEYPYGTRFHSGFIARAHVRDHKAFYKLVAQAREYLTSKQEAQRKHAEAEAAARAIRQEMFKPQSIITNPDLCRVLANQSKCGIYSERRIGHEVPAKPYDFANYAAVSNTAATLNKTSAKKGTHKPSLARVVEA